MSKYERNGITLDESEISQHITTANECYRDRNYKTAMLYYNATGVKCLKAEALYEEACQMQNWHRIELAHQMFKRGAEMYRKVGGWDR